MEIHLYAELNSFGKTFGQAEGSPLELRVESPTTLGSLLALLVV